MYKGYELIIGLEIHAELATASKIFCACPTTFGGKPNTKCCPICMGFPGTMPVLNRKVLQLAIKAGLATGCRISSLVKFDRKHYSYPDLPKGYQITQYDTPLCINGVVAIPTETGEKPIRITRIHMEEDAGKLLHRGDKGTLIDHNRCGVPLIEVVTEPDIRSADEAVTFLKTLRTLLLYAGVSDCKMQEGSLRCDVNLSVRKVGETVLGVRTEMKNLNSFTNIHKAIQAEYHRQVDLLENHSAVRRETRRFDPGTGQTTLLRVKESESDYRFLAEPDLPPFALPSAWVESLRDEIPRLPLQRIQQYQAVYGLSEYDSRLLTASPAVADYFEACIKHTSYPKHLANLFIGELFRLLPADVVADHLTAEPSMIAAVATLLGEKKVNSTTSKRLLLAVWQEGANPYALVQKENLARIDDPTALSTVIESVLQANSDMVESYLRGKQNAAKALMGACMALTKGKADPVLLQMLLTKRLTELI